MQFTPESGIYGSWSGHFRDSNSKVAAYGMIHLLLDSPSLGGFGGHGSYCAGTVIASGREEQEGEISMTISGSPDDPVADSSLEFTISFQGKLQMIDDQSCISGVWQTPSESGSLLLHKLPTWVHRLKWGLLPAPQRTPRSLWKFALSAVRYQVRLARGLLPVADIMEIRRGAELARYQYLLGNIDANDEDEFQDSLYKSTPWDARVYRCAARTSIEWTLHV